MTVSGLRRVPLVRIEDCVFHLDRVSAVVYSQEEHFTGYPWTVTVSMADGSEYLLSALDETNCQRILNEFVTVSLSTTIEEPPL